MSDAERACPSCGTESAGARFCRVCGQVMPALSSHQPAAPGRVTEPTLPPPASSTSEEHTQAERSLLRDPTLDPPPSPSTRPDPRARHGAQRSDRSAFAPTLATEPPTPSNPDIKATRPSPPSAVPISEGQILGALAPDATTSLLGRTLGGRYHVESIIGEGGFGAVYGATHLMLGERVAVKLLHAEWAVQPEFRARFVREAVALSRLRHPGIVTVLDFGEDSGRPYLVMEMVYGRSLARLIHEGPDQLTGSRLLALFDQVLEALEVAHAAGIVHRDMKPDNVLLVRDRSPTGAAGGGERVKVLDFGIALMDDQEGGGRLTATNAVQGTPSYMSPEQCRGRNVGPATDVYAVGAMLYETLAGEPPFSGDTSTDVMVKHMFMVPPPVSERGWRRTAPPELEALAHWALAKRPEERPTASELRATLRRVAQGEDAVSRARREAEGRVAHLSLSREERALSPARDEEGRAAQTPVQGAQVVMWGMTRERTESMRAALAVNGMTGISWVEEGAPPATMGGQAVKAVVVAGAERGEVLSRVLRSAEGSGARVALPLVVVDVEGADRIAGLIRAGASDVALAGVGDEEACRKVWRVVERGR